MEYSSHKLSRSQLGKDNFALQTLASNRTSIACSQFKIFLWTFWKNAIHSYFQNKLFRACQITTVHRMKIKRTKIYNIWVPLSNSKICISSSCLFMMYVQKSNCLVKWSILHRNYNFWMFLMLFTWQVWNLHDNRPLEGSGYQL